MPSLELVVVNLERSTGSEFSDVEWPLWIVIYSVSFMVILFLIIQVYVFYTFCLHVLGGSYSINLKF